MGPVSPRFVLLRGGEGPPMAAVDAATTKSATASDVELAAALSRGDPQAPHTAWQRYQAMVRANLRRLMGPGLDEDDLCQEVFLRFFRRVHTLRDPGALRSFLFAICLRVTREELRLRWLRRWLRLTPDGTIPDAEPSPVRDAVDVEAREAVGRYYAILDRIGGQARSLFVARHVEGLELGEVARLHGLSLSTTQRHLARVVKRVDAMVSRDPLLAEIVAEKGGRS